MRACCSSGCGTRWGRTSRRCPAKAGLRAIAAWTSSSLDDQAVLLDRVVDHRALQDVLEGAHMQAVAQRLLGFRPLAGLALDPVELAVELVAHLVDRDRGAAHPAIDRDVGAADMRDFGAAAADAQHVADAPQAEADDQHAQQDGADDVAGDLAESVHGSRLWRKGGRTTGRMPTTGPPCRQRFRPLDTLTAQYEDIHGPHPPAADRRQLEDERPEGRCAWRWPRASPTA